MTEEIKFPFTPSKKVVEAFEDSTRAKRVTVTLMKALYEVCLENTIDPWKIVTQEHPSLAEYYSKHLDKPLIFDDMIEKIVLKNGS